VASDDNLIDVRFPVQYVIRPHTTEHQDYRGYAGVPAAGTLKPGDEVVVLPSGLSTTIAGIDTYDSLAQGAESIDFARPGEAVTVRLSDNLDVSRGDMICRPHNRPEVTQDVEAMVCWMDAEAPLTPRTIYTLKHTTRTVRAMVTELRYRLDINTMQRDEEASVLSLNEIGRVVLRSTEPIFVDDYRRNRQTGSFILIDESTNQTVAGGMIRLTNT
jgi:bifunctional enzyme CysN/CysC